ncbi:SCO family protein [Hymenobacter sp. HDW8]|uniref:SCO family protein n=1 Tax=Hymenobacter sp. HDW8 TaxID=2714932 RepID=UPI0014094D04|nr:SCO family protein [Hymenobacter sp. HDW8]QIL75631.1 SCO family protein [Hymenobacter sp. HDW8]
MRPKQTLFLGLILLVPVLTFLFLKSFGTNRYALPFYLPDRVDSTLVGDKWQRDTVFHQLKDYSFFSQTGRVIGQKDLKDGLYITSFFYTACPQDCAQRYSQLTRVQEKFRLEPRVRLVSYTVNPMQDSVPVLERYAEQYGAIAGKWFFLTGDKNQLNRLLTEEYRLPVLEGEPSAIQHSQQLFLVDRNHRIRGIYDGTKAREIDRLITEITVLLYTYDHNNEPRS